MLRLEKCPKCLSEISAYVGFCPNCGHRLFRGRDYFYWIGIVAFSIGTLISVLLIVWGIASFVYISSTEVPEGDNSAIVIYLFLPIGLFGLVVMGIGLLSQIRMWRQKK